jgi:hypothetical protein
MLQNLALWICSIPAKKHYYLFIHSSMPFVLLYSVPAEVYKKHYKMAGK